ncbi:MAG: FHA domain-containing protein [Elusimicrobiota bacterium]|jgi:pSer/pThr/pTyr-binding forkhead associated (FHA) protein|nr:FHA domain-containing protein [Elusimicrobiota bacterium]
MSRLLLEKRAEILGDYVLMKSSTITVGSQKGNTIVLQKDKNISEVHCVIFSKGEGKFKTWIVKDQNTISGTKVNGDNILEKTLKYGDVINISSYNIVFCRQYFETQEEHSYLLGIYGHYNGKKYNIKNGDTYIGRAMFSKQNSNDIVLLQDNTVSKGHAKITNSNGKYSITDTGSASGIVVNGAKVGQLNTVDLTIGDEILIGHSIFRLASSNDEDFSTPAKQKITFFKLQKYFSLLITLSVFLFSFGMMKISCSNISALSKHKDALDITLNTDANFKVNISTKSNKEKTSHVSNVAIGKLKGGDKNYIVMLMMSGFLCAWDPNTGNNLWKPIGVDTTGETAPMIADVNDDGKEDIIVCTSSDKLLIFDGTSSATIRQEVLGGTIFKTTPLVADLNGDGKKDVVVCSRDGRVNFIFNAGFASNTEMWTDFIEGEITTSPVLWTYKENDSIVVIANSKGKVFLINPRLKVKKVVDIVKQTGKIHVIGASPAIGDITGDGVPEVVVQTSGMQYISAIDVVNLKVLWTFFMEEEAKIDRKENSNEDKNILEVESKDEIPGDCSVPMISKLSDDSNSGDVFAISAAGTAYALRGDTGHIAGEVLWKQNIPEMENIISYPSKYDFDKDGTDDFVLCDKNGGLFIIRGNKKHKEFDTIAEVKASNTAITSTPLISDIFGLGKISIVFANSTDNLQVVDTNSSIIKNLNPWAMWLGNAEHTGFKGIKEYKIKYWKLLSIGFFVFIVFFILKIQFSAKKRANRVKMKFL